MRLTMRIPGGEPVAVDGVNTLQLDACGRRWRIIVSDGVLVVTLEEPHGESLLVLPRVSNAVALHSGR